jgi:hypothetical protein
VNKIFVESNEFTEELIRKVSEGITLRNKIIHRSKLDVSEEDARSVLANVRALAAVLSKDIDKQYINRENSV